MTTQITLLNVLQELIEIKTMLQNLLSAKAQEGAEPSTNNGAEEVAGDGS
jgi:hypothetical protein